MATKTRTMFETRNDLPVENREKLVDLLNARLADTFDLYSQVKQAHWNVKGPDFIQLHELYDMVAETVLPFVDEIAERATALGGLATGTVRMAAEATCEERRRDRLEMRLARPRGVERFEAPGGLEHQGRSVAAAGAGERDLGPQPLQPGAL